MRASGWKEADRVNMTTHSMFIKFTQALTSNSAGKLAAKTKRASSYGKVRDRELEDINKNVDIT